MREITLISSNNLSIVKIDKGELVSYIKNDEELIHQKGNPGWRNSDTEMFPIIGPTEFNNFTVSTPKGDCIQDQHGLLRELNYNLINSSSDTAVYQKKYIENTAIKNSKFPEKSPKEIVSWPYNFTFIKNYELTNNSLIISFEIKADKGMPFMLGYHPAFMLQGNLNEIVSSEKQHITIPKIIEGGNTAFPILNVNKVSLIKETGLNILIKTIGFKHFMLWTEVSNMLCIEPITAYPYTEGQFLSKSLFDESNGLETFTVVIEPFN